MVNLLDKAEFWRTQPNIHDPASHREYRQSGLSSNQKLCKDRVIFYMLSGL